MSSLDPDEAAESDRDRDEEDVVLAKAENIYKQRYGFDIFQMNHWGGGQKKNEATYAQQLTYKSKRKFL